MNTATRALASLVLSALGLAGAAAASDDRTIVSRVSRDGKPTGTATSYITSDHVRMARDGHEIIVDLKTGTMTQLDEKKKTYSVVTKQDMERLKLKMQERLNSPEMKEARERMDKMSPAERKQMDSALSGLSQMDVKKTGATRKIAGYACEEWTITIGGFSTTRECLTSDLQYPAHAWDTFKDFTEGLKSSLAAFGPLAKSGAEMVEKMKKMKGFPLATATAVDVLGQKSSTESEVTEVRHGSIPASAWDVPAGYAKVENPMLKAFDRPGRERPRR